ncbi:hypothetical protein CW304_33135 [Bacillus sp. UFRGS-B20]|nr:hypothetical protein CW304_33135 [Bacillus sp. UFRGS-B20]
MLSHISSIAPPRICIGKRVGCHLHSHHKPPGVITHCSSASSSFDSSSSGTIDRMSHVAVKLQQTTKSAAIPCTLGSGGRIIQSCHCFHHARKRCWR